MQEVSADVTCPKCKNPNAECVIGNFWKCPVCDRTPAATHQKNPTTLLEIIAHAVAGMWPQGKIDDMVRRRGDIPPVVGDFFGHDSSVQTAWWRIELAAIRIQKCRHNKAELVDYIDWVIGDALHHVILPDLAARTVALRGGGKIESMAGLGVPHWVADDGQILVRYLDDGDGFELRMRAIWKPAQP